MADLITHLVTHDIVGFLAMDTAVQHMRRVGGRLSSSILETADIEPRVLLEAISAFYGLDYATDELLLSIDPDVPQFWRHDNALRLGAIPLALDASGLTLGVLEPLSQFHLEEVKEEYGSNIRQLLLLEFRFFELCNRFFDVVLEQRYAIWASKFPLQDNKSEKASTNEHEVLLVDEGDGEALFDATDLTDLSTLDAQAGREQTTESTDTVDDHTLETESTDAEDNDDVPPFPEDATHILTGSREASELLGHAADFEAAFAPSDDALFLIDPADTDASDTQDIPTLREHTPAHPTPPTPEDLTLEDATEARRGKEPSMPSIRIRSNESKPRIRVGRHTPTKIDTTDAQEHGEDSGLLRGREPFPSPNQATMVSGAFRIGYPVQRNTQDPLVAKASIARKLRLVDAAGSWAQTDAIMNTLSEQESSHSRTITSVDIRAIYKKAKRVEELLYPTLTYFGAFFERRFFMHFWQPHRSTGLLMQGVRGQTTTFTRIEVPYDESSGVHKMRKTGNYLQGSPIDIGFLTLYTRLGIPTAQEAIAMPIYVDNEVVMMLLMDNGPDRPLEDTLVASEIALILQQLGRELDKLSEQPRGRTDHATPIDGEVAATSDSPERPATLSTAAPLIPPELLDDVELPPAPSDDLEIAMDSMQMDPVENEEADDLTLDSIEEFFGSKFQAPSAPSKQSEGSDSFEIAISTDQELSPAARALLEQDTRRDDKRAVSIIVADDERSDADIAYDLIPPTTSDLIRPPAPKEPPADGADEKGERVSRTTARHHALSGHNQYTEPSRQSDTPHSSEPVDPKPASANRTQWNARDLARLLRVGSTEFPLPETATTDEHQPQSHQDTQEQEADQKLQDTQEQKADQKLQDTQEQKTDQKLQDTQEQNTDQKLQDTQEQKTDQKLQDTQEQEITSTSEDTAAHATDPLARQITAREATPSGTDATSKAEDLRADADTPAAPSHRSRPATSTLATKAAAATPTTAEPATRPAQEPSTQDEADAAAETPAPQANVDEDAAEQLRKILQERQQAKIKARQQAKTRLESTVDTQDSGSAAAVENDDDAPQETMMFSPEALRNEAPAEPRRTQKTHVLAPRTLPAAEIVSIQDAVPPTPPPSTSTSKEIDLDAVLNEVDQTPPPADVDRLADEVAKKLIQQGSEGATASLVRLVELTESQRRMGTAAIKPLSLAMETLLRGAPEDRPAALRELIATPTSALPDIHSEFPGPLLLDRTDATQAARPLSEHGPLLALVDARLYDFVPQLWACLERRSADARYYALRFLSLIRNLERRFVLVETAFDADAQIRELALRNIETFRNSPDFLLALENFRDRLQEQDPQIQVYAIDALVKLRDHDAISLLIEALNDANAQVQEAAHQGLKRLTFIDHGTDAKAWEQWRALHGRELPEQWLVDAMDAVEPLRRALAARALENITGLVVNYHPDMSQQGLLRAKMTVERHFGFRR